MGVQPCHWAPKTIDNGEKCLGRKIVDLSDSSNGWLILCFSSMSLFDLLSIFLMLQKLSSPPSRSLRELAQGS
jgi:hypothetical protein